MIDKNNPHFLSWWMTSRTVWSSASASDPASGAVYVDLFHDFPDYLLYSLHIGRLIGMITGLPVIGLTGRNGALDGACAGFDAADVEALAAGFDVPVLRWDDGPSVARALDWFSTLSRESGRDLTEIEEAALRRLLRSACLPDGFPIGRYVHDTYLRNTLRETVAALDGGLVQSAASCLGFEDFLARQFTAAPPRWFVTGHIDYAPWGLATDHALRRGARVAYFRNEGNVRIHLFGGAPMGEETLSGRVRKNQSAFINACIDDLVSRSDDRIAKHFKNVAGGERFRSHRFVPSHLAQLGQSTASRTVPVLRKRLGLSEDIPVVSIFSITFCDIPTTDEQVFDDNFQWLDETLSFAATRPDIQWIVKIHPSDLAYNRTSAMARLRARYADQTHLRFVEAEWSPTLVMLASDVVTTLRGSPGHQAAMMGINAVFCGRGQYSDFGFAHVAQTKDQYFDMLAAFAHAPPDASGMALRAQAFAFLEDVAFANPSSFLGAFGDARLWTDEGWGRLVDRLRWYSPETDPLAVALARAIEQNAPRVGGDCLHPRYGLRAIHDTPHPSNAGNAEIRGNWPHALVPLLGFHATESWGVWTNGEPAAFLIRLDQAFSGRFRIRLTCLAHVPHNWVMPRISALRINGLPAEEVPSAGGEASAELIFDSAAGEFGSDGYVLVEFETEGGTIPASIGAGSDTRNLVLTLEAIAWEILPEAFPVMEPEIVPDVALEHLDDPPLAR